jgi:hypothetical protein
LDTPSDQLRGWKEIAAYLKASERSVMRWEASRGLPVRRIPGDARDAVFATRQELDAWLKRSSVASPQSTDTADDAAASEPAPAEKAPSDAPRSARRRASAALAIAVPALIVAASVFAYTSWRASTAETGDAPDGAGSVADVGAPTAAATAAGADDRRGEPDAITLELSGPGRSLSSIGVAPGRCGYTEYASGDRLEFCARPAGEWLDVSVLFTPKPDARKPPGRQAPTTFRLARDTKIRILSPLVLDLEWVSPAPAPLPARGGRAH